MLALIETNPSVVIWSLYNESWGALDIGTNQDTRDYIIEMYHYMHIHHSLFLVVDNDGWQHNHAFLLKLPPYREPDT
jgi:hypothetical protein